MLCHKIVHIKFQCKHNYIVSMILQISGQSGTREQGQLVLCENILKCQENRCMWVSVNLKTECERITKHINMSNSTCYLETFKTFIKWAGFYYNKWKSFALFYCKIKFRSIRSWKSEKSKLRFNKLLLILRKRAAFFI